MADMRSETHMGDERPKEIWEKCIETILGKKLEAGRFDHLDRCDHSSTCFPTDRLFYMSLLDVSPLLLEKRENYN